MSRGTDRRTVLKAVGGTAALTGLAGCTWGGDGDGGDGGGGDGGGSDGGGSDGGTTGGNSGSGPITVGHVRNLTGTYGELSDEIGATRDMALEMINEAGGPLDRELQAQARDSANNPQNARNIVQQFVANDRPAIWGMYTSEITTLQEFLTDQQTPIVTALPGAAALNDYGGDNGTPDDLSDDEWIWRTMLSDSNQTAGGAQFCLDQGWETMGVIMGNSEGSQSWADGFIDQFERGGGEMVDEITAQEGKSDYSAELDRLFSNDVDAFFMSFGNQDTITATRNWARGGYGGNLMVSDIQQDTFMESIGDTAENVWMTQPLPEGPNYEWFAENYDGPENTPWGIGTFDCVMVTALAIHRAGEATPEAIERNLGPVSREGGTEVNNFAEGKEELDAGNEINYQGVMTPVDFTAKGNVIGSAAVHSYNGTDGWSEAETYQASTLEDLLEL